MARKKLKLPESTGDGKKLSLDQAMRFRAAANKISRYALVAQGYIDNGDFETAKDVATFIRAEAQLMIDIVDKGRGNF